MDGGSATRLRLAIRAVIALLLLGFIASAATQSTAHPTCSVSIILKAREVCNGSRRSRRKALRTHYVRPRIAPPGTDS